MIIKEQPLDMAVNRFFDESDRKGLERREGQVEMAQEITQAIMDNDSLIVEAEVGIGKSIAYLVPMVIQFFRERKQMIIATSTIALQEQLEQDINTVLDMIGVRTNVEVAKGMKNYLCLRRLSKFVKNNAGFEGLFEKAKEDLQNKSDITVSERDWNSICIDSFGDRCENCTFRSMCEYRKMRDRLRINDEIVICNQNMLVSHLIKSNENKGIFKHDLSTIVVDEAHNLESKFRDAFTTSFSQHEICTEIIKVARNRKHELSQVIIELIQMLDTLFKYLDHDICQQQKEAKDDIKAFYFRPNREIKLLIMEIRKNMAEIEARTDRKLRSLELFRDSAKSDHLVWLTTENGVRINVSKKDICKDIGRLLFAKGRRTILTSATISSGSEGTTKDKYRYFMNSLGCPENIRVSEPKKSPFDYKNHSMIYISNKLPCPRKYNREKYREAAIPEIVKLLRITNGKTLILFTAKDDMNYVCSELSRMRLPYKIMIQSNESSQEKRIRNFQNDTDSVILGTGAYWEGINVEGESLSQVIIFKLPFPVPEPIMEYNMSKAECPLMEVAVPEMIIKLKQGAGRLIRSISDKGIVSILDPRASKIMKTAYRETILSALPEKNISEDIRRIRRGWKNMKEDDRNDR